VKSHEPPDEDGKAKAVITTAPLKQKHVRSARKPGISTCNKNMKPTLKKRYFQQTPTDAAARVLTEQDLAVFPTACAAPRSRAMAAGLSVRDTTLFRPCCYRDCSQHYQRHPAPQPNFKRSLEFRSLSTCQKNATLPCGAEPRWQSFLPALQRSACLYGGGGLLFTFLTRDVYKSR